MSGNRAIPQGYMTVGEVAKKMGVTVRTLQYYDKQGLLSPSGESRGGRRLYTDQDVVQLHQILSMKSLGFSLDDIKNRLVSLDTPAAVARALSEQAAAVREKLESLSASLQAIETLRQEVLQMQAVDFKKYADIIVNLQMKNEYYWLIKHFDDKTLDQFRRRFDKDSGPAMLETFQRLNQQAIQLQESGVAPESAQGQQFAAAFWSMVLEFTGGDTAMLTQLMQLGRIDGPEPEQRQQALADAFIAPARSVYFDQMGYDPFGGAAK